MSVQRVGVIATAIASIVYVAGCASYATPGRAADLRAVGVSQAMVAGGTESAIQQQLGKRPLAALPTGIAVVRIQAPAYRSAVGFVAILLVLTLRPRGLLGERAY